MEKIKVIFDTDPGVDDNNALIYALNDKRFDIKLITISNGNIGIEKSTRNVLHLLDVFNLDIPVVRGYSQRFGSNTEDAIFLHGKEGLGSYNPPMTTSHQALDRDCSDVIYETLKQYPGEITFVVLGPHTNVAYLLQKYPDAKDYIKEIVMMGGAPDGILTNPNHTSFNIRTDAPSFQVSIDTKLPIIMCPSRIGRDVLYFTEEQVELINSKGLVGRFITKTFDTYWEHGYPDRRISTCDISAIYYIIYPELYKTAKCDIVLDLEQAVGKTTAIYKDDGQFTLIKDADREAIHKIFFDILDDISKIEITNKHFIENNA